MPVYSMYKFLQSKLVIILILLVICTGVVGGTIQATTDSWLKTSFDDLLPSGHASDWTNAIVNERKSYFERIVIIAIESNSEEELGNIYSFIKGRFELGGYYQGNQAGINNTLNTLHNVITQYKYNLLTTEHKNLLSQGPDVFYQHQLKLLFSPIGNIVNISPDEDPNGTVGEYIKQVMMLFNQQAPEKIADRHYKMYAYMIDSNNLDFTEQAKLYDISVELRSIVQSMGSHVYFTGVPLYTGYGASSASQEIQVIGVGSILLLVCSILLFMRSLISLGIVILTICISTICSLAFTLFILEKIHILTIVFGATLIGISADYCFHYLCGTVSNSSKIDNQAIRNSIIVASSTTCIAFLVFLALPFPGIRQIGLYMAVGIAVTALQVYYLFPLYGKFIIDKNNKVRQWPRSITAPRLFLVVLVAVAVIGASSIPYLDFDDDVRSFYASPTELVSDERQISQLFNYYPSSQFIIVTGENQQSVLKQEHAFLHKARNIQKDNSEIFSITGMTDIIPPVEVQRENHELSVNALLSAEFQDYFSSLGIGKAKYDKVLSNIPMEFNPLLPDEMQSISIPPIYGSYAGCNDHECASWVNFNGELPELPELMQYDNSIKLISPIKTVNDILEQYRIALLYLLLIVMAAVSLWLFFWIGLQKMLVVLINLLAILSAVIASLVFLQGELSLFNILALFLTLGLALDYTIFRYLISYNKQPSVSLAIFLSAITSLFAFGTLSLSETPAISDFGITITLGVMATYATSWIRVKVND